MPLLFIKRSKVGVALLFFDKERERSSTLKKWERLTHWSYGEFSTYNISVRPSSITISIWKHSRKNFIQDNTKGVDITKKTEWVFVFNDFWVDYFGCHPQNRTCKKQFTYKKGKPNKYQFKIPQKDEPNHCPSTFYFRLKS